MAGKFDFKRVLLIIGIVGLLLACSIPGIGNDEPTATADSNQAIETSVAQTVAAQSGSEDQDDTNENGEETAPTETEEQQPENTPTLTATPEPTATPSVPVVHVSVDTNCRYGPGVIYDPPVTYLPKDEPALVYGRDPNGDFYYIDKNCYVWTGYLTVDGGNIASVPIFTPVPTPTPGITFAGTWETSCALATCGDLTIEINGNQVSGTYANGDGTIEGTLDDDHIVGIWKRNGNQGSIDFWLANDGQTWVGNYGGNTAWCGTRPNGALPNPCKLATWYGTWETDCAAGTCGQIVIEQDKYKITGTYANGDGTIDGTAEIDVINGKWYRNNTNGSIQFFMVGNGLQFQGNYGGSSKWCGWRASSSAPNPCLKP